jgi:hypothetical protein
MAMARAKRKAGARKPAGRAAKARAASRAPRGGKAKVRAAAARTARAKGRAAAPALSMPMPGCLVEAAVEPAVIEVPARKVVSIDGAGPPDGPSFGPSIGALYGAAYGLKFSRKPRGTSFRIGPLEGRWWAEGVPEATLLAPPEHWRWRLRIAVPDDVAEAELEAVVAAATSRKGRNLEGSDAARSVRLERIPAARVGRILHVGPYSEEPRSFAKLDAAVEAAGLVPARSHVEIYLSDPRRTAPARLRTVLLRELEDRSVRER